MTGRTTILADLLSKAEMDYDYRHKDGVNATKVDGATRWVVGENFIEYLIQIGTSTSTSKNGILKNMWAELDNQ